MVRHGSRPRKAWWPGREWAYVLKAVRFRCGRYPVDYARCCGSTVTVLPGCLYPYRRYPLEIIQEVIFARFLTLLSWGSVAVRVCQDTARNWCINFSLAAQGWLTGLLHWWSHSPQFVVPAAVESSAESGLLSTAGLCMDLREQELTGNSLDERQLFQRLWEWGFERLKGIPLLSTRLSEGGKALSRPKGRDPDAEENFDRGRPR